MAKIKIAGVAKSDQGYTVHVVLVETAEIEGQEAEQPIGEAFITVSKDNERADVKDKIMTAGQDIMKARKDARDKRKDIEELDFPEILE